MRPRFGRHKGFGHFIGTAKGKVPAELQSRINKHSNSYKEADRFSDDWKAVHDATSFWRYLNLLVNQGFVNESIAFGAFSSPRILGFLYPIEKAFVGEERLAYEESLQSLYDRWKARQDRRQG